uniref:Sulfatase N-terminal domain-containing protein n=2 Tax=Parascaris univalens TaxID=6257 RepID=A0A915C8D7_PARUN
MVRRKLLKLIIGTLSKSLTDKRRFIFLVLISLFACGIYYGRNLFVDENLPIEFLHYKYLIERNGSSSNTCNIPQLDPWDETIIKYYAKPKPLECKPLQSNVTVLRNGFLMVLNEYREKLKCRCRTFEHNTNISDFHVKYNDWIDVDPITGTKIEKEFVEVECYNIGLIPTKIYSYHWNQIIKKQFSIKSKSAFLVSSIDHPSVLMFGFDGMSHSNFIRVLPKTYAQLQKMGFIDLRGHVKIGDNTFPNLCAILTGKRSSPTKEFIGELTDEWNIYFDDWPFIWNNFSQNGYVTVFAEDRPDIGTFNYLDLIGLQRIGICYFDEALQTVTIVFQLMIYS